MINFQYALIFDHTLNLYKLIPKIKKNYTHQKNKSMKKLFLFATAMSIATSAFAIDNYEFEGFAVQGLSRNGAYAVSNAEGHAIFVNLNTPTLDSQ